MSKPKVLVFIDWYLPGFRAGGPIRSCANMVSRLKEQIHFRVFTGDRDLGSDTPYEGVIADQWNARTPDEEVYYCSREKLNHQTIAQLIKEEKPDFIYLNSMFSQWFTLAPLLATRKHENIKVVLAPRGMLSPGALGIKSGKKKLFLGFARVMKLFKNVTWHASTELEVKEIHKMFGTKAKVIHAMNLTAIHRLQPAPVEKKPNQLELVYVGRISIVKNTLQTIEVLGQTNPSHQIRLNIYGPFDDPSYFEKCQTAAASLPKHVTVKFHGPLDNHMITSRLETAHFLYQLSFNENFGHAIVESLTAGRPVIISDRTPWINLEAQKCGFDLDLFDNSKIAAALDRAAAMDQSEYNEWTKAALAFAMENIDNKEHIDRNLSLFTV